MDLTNNLFDQFEGATREMWLARMEKELKGKPISDLYWHLDLDESIVLAPFYHSDDVVSAYPPILRAAVGNSWEIGAYCEVADVSRANLEVLEGLHGGVQAPLFQCASDLNDAELSTLLQGIDITMISTHFGQYFPGKDPQKLLFQFNRYIKKQGFRSADVAGSIDCDPILDWPEPPFDMQAEMIRFAADVMPKFKVLQINARRLHSGPENTAWELAFTIAKAAEYLAQMGIRGIPPEIVNRHLQYSVTLSTSYFVEIAKLRALRLMWAKVLEAFDTPKPAHTVIEAHFAPETQNEDANTNLIKAATQSMAASIGGADILYVLPANTPKLEESNVFTRRMARNVQHILKMESHLDRVADPAAGSYYIEHLTNSLAQRAWAIFQEIEAKGGYLIAG
jgi:methylmalonyl-CoA mutase